MKKLLIIYLWAFIVFLLLSVLVGIVATILQFMIGDIVGGFSDLLLPCINGWVLAATVGVIAYEKRGDNNE